MLLAGVNPEQKDRQVSYFYIKFPVAAFIDPHNRLWLNELLHALATDRMPSEEVVRAVDLVEDVVYLEVANEIVATHYNMPWSLSQDIETFYGVFYEVVHAKADDMNLGYMHAEYDTLRALYAIRMEEHHANPNKRKATPFTDTKDTSKMLRVT
jgi:hypothetical protein